MELLVVLGIFSIMFAVVAGGVAQFRQTIIVSNASKELLLNLRKARRDALGNVVTSEGYSPEGYYIALDTTGDDNTYYWGECTETSCSTSTTPLQSAEFAGIIIEPCSGGGKNYNYIKFNHVNGEFVFADVSDVNDLIGASSSTTACEIDLYVKGALSTSKRTIEINGLERTIKMKTD